MTAPDGFTVTDTPQHVEMTLRVGMAGTVTRRLTPAEALDLGHALIDAANDALAHRDPTDDRLDEARDELWRTWRTR